MKLKNYTKEQLDNGEIVRIKFHFIYPTYCVLPIEVIKSTAKQMVIRDERIERTVAFEKFGNTDWGGIYCLKEDVEAIIRDYKVIKIAHYEEGIAKLQREIEEINQLKEEN